MTETRDQAQSTQVTSRRHVGASEDKRPPLIN